MKYDEHHISKIVTELENGGGRVRACKIANISYETFSDWYKNKSEFSELIKKAEDTGNDRIKDLQKRKIIEDKSWQSGAWWLERNYPDEFAKRAPKEKDEKTNHEYVFRFGGIVGDELTVENLIDNSDNDN